MPEERSIVRVGRKKKKAYLAAVFYQLDKYGRSILRGLGHQQSKVMEIKLDVEDIDGVEAKRTESVVVDDTPGIEVIFERGGENG